MGLWEVGEVVGGWGRRRVRFWEAGRGRWVRMREVGDERGGGCEVVEDWREGGRGCGRLGMGRWGGWQVEVCGGRL